MTELGDYLKTERQRQGLEVSDVAQQSKIPLATLVAIEAGDKGNLPAKPFLRGFVRSYAKLLGLDLELTIQLFEKEYGAAGAPLKPRAVHAPTQQPEYIEQEQESVAIFQAPKSYFIFLWLVVATVLCILIYLALEKISSYEQEKSNAELDMPSQPVDIKTEVNLGAVADDKPAPLADDGQAETLAQDSKLSADPSPEGVAKAAPTPTADEAVPTVVTDKPTKIEPENSPAAPTKEPVRPVRPQVNKLTIEAFEPVRLEVVWSTGSPQVFLLKANETKNLIFTKPIKVLLNDGGVINVIFNGRALGVPGKIRQPVELNYP